LYVDGALYATDAASPFAFGWDTTGLIGQHTLFAKIFDSAGNNATSSTITAMVGSTDTVPPDVQLTGVVYDGKSLSITASATDQQSAITKVEFYIDGKLKTTDTASPWSTKINSKPLGAGSHSVQAKGYDSAGNVGISGSVTVTTK
jgi:hypothetical protein